MPPPYRNSSTIEAAEVESRSGWELVFVYAIVWTAALVHVAYLLATHERFGFEGMVAAVVVALLPVLAARSLIDIKER